MTLRLHFPVSSVIRAPHAVLEAGGQGWLKVPVRYGIVEHPRHGPILIDTGYTRHLWAAKGWGLALYRRLMAPRLTDALTPSAALARLGYRPADVRHVVVTHLHADHVCGLQDFAHATFHVSEVVARTWATPKRWQDASEAVFRSLLPSNPRLQAMETSPRAALPFLPPWKNGHDVFGDGSVVLVALDGHQEGHVGVVVQTDRGSVLYAVDASWTRWGYRQQKLPPAPLRWVVADPAGVLETCGVVKKAEEHGYTVVLCHDPEPTPWDMEALP